MSSLTVSSLIALAVAEPKPGRDRGDTDTGTDGGCVCVGVCVGVCACVGVCVGVVVVADGERGVAGLTGADTEAGDRDRGGEREGETGTESGTERGREGGSVALVDESGLCVGEYCGLSE